MKKGRITTQEERVQIVRECIRLPRELNPVVIDYTANK